MDVMIHSSTFLLPGNDHSSSVTYALVVLNQRLPRFTPILWNHGSVSLVFFSFFACLRACVSVTMFVLLVFWRRVCVEQHRCGCVLMEVPIGCSTKCLSCSPATTLLMFDTGPPLDLLRAREFMMDAVRPDKSEHHKVLDGMKYQLAILHCRDMNYVRYKPDIIKGDMDSIRTEVLDFYTNLGTKVVDESHDQDTTDLRKCVAYVRDLAPNLDKSNLCILVAGALGGRFDHEAGNINVLYRFSTIRIILLSDDCLIYLLPRTHHHEIHIQSSVEGPHCGLIPIGMTSVSTTTTGLQWDLTDTEMRFGDLAVFAFLSAVTWKSCLKPYEASPIAELFLQLFGD
ncbi:hypothetical protein DKX38_003238 [Salix brachista]|uniref:thiamine diphosphokinase n=1 Tax=Salix brachista TaxID=2182728 RepID=A0A5N5NPC4_9ROSI|nr:hypothetical protein DKX38_003238 [Salix brachista]